MEPFTKLFALFSALAAVPTALFVVYWLIRLGVRDGLRDHRRKAERTP